MPGRVLIVDDVAPNIRLLEAKLSAEYFDVISASNGADALQLAASDSPDLILLDVMMPGMDGFETCRRLKADAATHHIPIVMVTALSDASDRVRGLEAGADDFLTKPVNDTALFARVRSLIRLKTMTDELRLREETSHQLGLMLGAGSEAVDVRRASVLIVEDNSIDIANIKEVLLIDCDSIETASTTAAGLEAVRNACHDLVITSLGMRSGDALRFCSQLRAQEKSRQLPILLVAEEDEIQRVAKAMDIGVNDYLLKPIDRNELLARARTQIRRRRYQDRLRENYQHSLSLALTDSLTGLYNRRYLYSHLKGLTARSGDSQKDMSILLIDIDHFKQVNDQHGHIAGDAVLRELADRIMKNVRNFDLVARLGGEEFVIVMPDADRTIAERVAERLRTRIFDEIFRIQEPDVQIPISVSIGIASKQDDEEWAEVDPTELLRRADIALYAAKNAGRNAVRFYDPSMTMPGDQEKPASAD